jgi:hypothetical protein
MENASWPAVNAAEALITIAYWVPALTVVGAEKFAVKNIFWPVGQLVIVVEDVARSPPVGTPPLVARILTVIAGGAPPQK